ncbi:unnamed protein product [Cochlearia groenlandica]
MSSSQKSSAPSASASRSAIEGANRSAVPNERVRRGDDILSPAVGSAVDRASVLPSAGVPGSSSHSKDSVRMDPPPRRAKVSAKSVVKPVEAEKTPTAPKKTKPKTAETGPCVLFVQERGYGFLCPDFSYPLPKRDRWLSRS